jgi:hypothetical protein
MTNCGCRFIPRNILPRYSPIRPRKRRMIPVEKQMATMVEGQPICMVGTINFRITIPMAPRILKKEKRYPT